MDRGRVGDERGSKEMDGCPLTAMSPANIDVKGLSFAYLRYLPWMMHTLDSDI
jgi:hypothetical protein